MIAGAPYYTPYLVSPELGRAYCILGSSNLTGNVSVSMSKITMTGAEAGGRLGWAILPIDMDLDQKPELAASAPFATGTGKESGAVFVFENNISGEVSPEDAKWTFNGHKAGSAAR